jgi:2-hydroxy-3-oxopropionate reductase
MIGSTRVGFAGLGIMGRPMAENLIVAGFRLTVWNRSPDAAHALAARGATVATDIRTLGGESDVVITMLSDDDAVSSVYGGADGLIASAQPGTLLIDMSTVSPALSRQLVGAARQRDLAMLDAPVSGGDVGARAGSLSIMVGGDAGAVRRAQPVFEVLGDRVVHVGRAGAGQVTKACNQVVVAVVFAALSEALVLGSKLGVSPAAILDALSGGMAANRVIEVRRQNLLDHDFRPGFKVDLHHKDLQIALAAAAGADVALPLAALVQQMFHQLRAAGFGDEDDSALLRIAETAAAHRIAGDATGHGDDG